MALAIVLQIVVAYVLVDALTGIYHLATDRGWNFASQCALFEIHHTTNSMDGFDWQPMVAAVPTAVVGAWFHSPFFVAVGLIGCLAQLPHYWAHQGGGRVVRWLQTSRLIIHPAHHAGHHSGQFNRNFCILSGWNDWWLNRVASLLEAIA